MPVLVLVLLHNTTSTTSCNQMWNNLLCTSTRSTCGKEWWGEDATLLSLFKPKILWGNHNPSICFIFQKYYIIKGPSKKKKTSFLFQEITWKKKIRWLNKKNDDTVERLLLIIPNKVEFAFTKFYMISNNRNIFRKKCITKKIISL